MSPDIKAMKGLYSIVREECNVGVMVVSRLDLAGSPCKHVGSAQSAGLFAVMLLVDVDPYSFCGLSGVELKRAIDGKTANVQVRCDGVDALRSRTAGAAHECGLCACVCAADHFAAAGGHAKGVRDVDADAVHAPVAAL
jgi:hypothetical protein